MKINYRIILVQTLLVCVLRCSIVTSLQSCLTPTDTQGYCIPYKKCAIVTQQTERYGDQLPQKFLEFVKSSQCSGSTRQFHMCCDKSYVSLPSKRLRSSIDAVPQIRTLTDTTPATGDLENPDRDGGFQINQQGFDILDAQQCGNADSNRIAFGEETNLGEFPWMALIRYDSSEKQFQCGGSLITDHFVLTAAHCIKNSADRVIGVRLGEHDIDSEIDCQRFGRKTICAPEVLDVGIDNIVIHPNYNRDEAINDGALIKLDRKVETNKYIQPICLPLTKSSMALNKDQRYYVAGWGTTENGSTAKVLQKAVIAHKDREVCQETYIYTRITDNHVCAGADGDSKMDACKGDSGGPLFFIGDYKGKPHFIQYGIVSFGGIGCGLNKTNPGIYSNVQQLLPWITNNID